MQVDWGGLGVVMFELLTGFLPFYAEERKMMYLQIVTEKTRFPRHVSQAKFLMVGGLNLGINSTLNI